MGQWEAAGRPMVSETGPGVPPSAPLAAPVVTSLARAEPVQIDIPAIEVSSSLVDLGLNDRRHPRGAGRLRQGRLVHRRQLPRRSAGPARADRRPRRRPERPGRLLPVARAGGGRRGDRHPGRQHRRGVHRHRQPAVPEGRPADRRDLRPRAATRRSCSSRARATSISPRGPIRTTSSSAPPWTWRGPSRRATSALPPGSPHRRPTCRTSDRAQTDRGERGGRRRHVPAGFGGGLLHGRRGPGRTRRREQQEPAAGRPAHQRPSRSRSSGCRTSRATTRRGRSWARPTSSRPG